MDSSQKSTGSLIVASGKSPGTASIWQRSSQSGVASGTCPGRNPRVTFDWTSEESLLPLDALPSERAALLLQCRQCLLVGSRSDPKELPATRPHPAGHGLDLDLNENPLDCRAHHRLHRFWLSDLHWSDRYILWCDYLFCACTVLMGLNNGDFDLDILVDCLGRRLFKDPLSDATPATAHVASVNYPKAD